VRDIARKRLDVSKAKLLWSREGIERALGSMLEREINAAADSIAGEIRGLVSPENRVIFARVVREIVGLVLADDGAPERRGTSAGMFNRV